MSTETMVKPAAGGARLLDHLPPLTTLGPFIALLLACVFFSTQSDRFLSGQNFSLILQQVMVVGVIAIGQTLIVLTAGIDLSCGMVMALGGMLSLWGRLRVRARSAQPRARRPSGPGQPRASLTCSWNSAMLTAVPISRGKASRVAK